MNYWIAASFALLVVVAVSAYFENCDDMQPTVWTRIGVTALYLWSGTVGVLIGLGVTRLMGW